MASALDDMDPVTYDIREWTKYQLENYAEKPRAGLPRGSELPVPKAKVHAMLLMFRYPTDDYPDLDTVAEAIGRDYGLVAKWRNEKKFWDMAFISAHIFLKSWVKVFIDMVEGKVKNEGKPDESRWETAIDEMMRLTNKTWGSFLRDQMCLKVREYNTLKRNKYWPVLYYYDRLLHRWLTLPAGRDQELYFEQYQKCSDQVIKAVEEHLHKSIDEGSKEETKALVKNLIAAKVRRRDVDCAVTALPEG